MSDEIIIDEYTLLNHIATGSSTQVWEAMEKGGGDRHYAMKLMLPEALAESEHRSVLKHEAKLSERLDHPNLVRFKKLVMNKKRGYMVMDYFRHRISKCSYKRTAFRFKFVSADSSNSCARCWDICTTSAGFIAT